MHNMMAMRGMVFAALLLLLCRVGYADEASDAEKMPAASMNEQILSVPGDPDRPVLLQVTVYKPNGSGPFPLAIVNHGATSDQPPAQQPRYHMTFAAYYFLSRGYAVAIPMMRGYAGSGGRLLAQGCDDVAMGMSSARDIEAVIGYMTRQPDVDGSRIIVEGQSFGGWNTLAVGTLNIPHVKGLIDFAGGMRASDCDAQDDSLIEAAGRLGAQTKIPSIWFFGDNDRIFPKSTWQAMFQRYTAAGGQAELVAYGPFMQDAHNMLGSEMALSIWVPKVDAFLAQIGLPSQPLYPEYMPTVPPPPSHYAELADVAALPYASAAMAALYQRFLAGPLPRAFAIGTQSASTASGGFDPDAHALKLCSQQSEHCRLYAVNNDVVWTRPTPAPPATPFAALADQDAIPYIDARGREGYQKFLTMRRPRAFVIAPDGAWEAASVGVDPLAYALKKCGQLHRDCKPYAVDGDVVWPNTM